MNVIPIPLPSPANAAPLRAVLLREDARLHHEPLLPGFLRDRACRRHRCGRDPGRQRAHPGLFILQLSLYCVSLFALLLGVNSARAESHEWPLLFSQPVARGALTCQANSSPYSRFSRPRSCSCFCPRSSRVRDRFSSFSFTFSASSLTAVFIALGLTSGFLARERVQGLIIAVASWLFLLVGFDLLALFGARWPLLQKSAGPLGRAPDAEPARCLPHSGALRDGTDPIRSREQDAARRVVARASGLWFALLCPLWLAALLAATSRYLSRWED